MLRVIVAVASQITPLVVESVVGDEVKFVVAHHYESLPRIHETADEVKDSPAIRPSINEVTDEDELAPFGVSDHALLLPVAKVFQKKFESLQLPVNISNEIPVMF